MQNLVIQQYSPLLISITIDPKKYILGDGMYYITYSTESKYALKPSTKSTLNSCVASGFMWTDTQKL